MRVHLLNAVKVAVLLGALGGGVGVTIAHSQAPAGLAPAVAPVALPALFERGRTYLFAVDCWPAWATQAASQSFKVDGLNPCFAELGTVTVVRPDGWVEIEGSDGAERRWWINSSRLYAMQPQPVRERAQR